MNREEKKQMVADVREGVMGAGVVVIAHQSRLSASETASLRRKTYESGTKLQVVKNSLAKLAFQGTPYEHLISLMKGPTAIAYSTDPVAAAKVIADFGNDNDKLQVLGGGMGEKSLSKDAVIALSKLPSLDALRGKLIGLIQAPATKVAGVVQAPAGQLARVFAAYGSKPQ